MIGEIHVVATPYFDKSTKTNTFKTRPCLVIGKADEYDYAVLPISTVTHKRYLDPMYDIPLNKEEYRFLDKDSYLRTHKQQVYNVAEFKYKIADFKNEYKEMYSEAIEKVKEFQRKIVSEAL